MIKQAKMRISDGIFGLQPSH